MKAGLFTRTVGIVMTVIFVFPTIVVVGSSFTSGTIIRFPPLGFSWRWYLDVIGDPQWMAAFRNSFAVAISAALIAMVVGVLLAMLAARSNVIPSGLVTALAVTPMIIPLVVLGIGFYIVAAALGLTGSVIGLALAHSSIGVPYVFVSVLAALTSVDPSVEEAARVSGANEFVTFGRITLPLIAPSAIIGGVLAFVSSWDEIIIASFMTSPAFRTLPVMMFSEVKTGAEPSTSAVAALVTLVSVLLMGAVGLVGAISSRRKRRRTAQD